MIDLQKKEKEMNNLSKWVDLLKLARSTYNKHCVFVDYLKIAAVRHIEIKLALDADVHGYYPDFKMEIKRDGGNITILAFSKGNDTYEFIRHCMWFARCQRDCEEILIPKLQDRNSRLCNHADNKRRRYIYCKY